MPRTAHSRHRLLPLVLCVVMAVTVSVCLVMSAGAGLVGPLQAVYVTAAFTGLAGALIASRQPRNSVGWLMLGMSLFTALSMVPFNYGYWALAHRFGPHGLAVGTLWIASWAWILPFGTAFPMILARFPSGRLYAHWHLIDELAVTGTLLLTVAVAVRPGPMYPLGTTSNPLGIDSHAFVDGSWYAGLIAVVISDVLAVASVAYRLRRTTGDERQQLKWIGSASGLILVSLGFVAVANLIFNVPLLPAMVPFSVTSLILPIAIGVAMLRYRLYDIDVIIDRALVYGGLTAVLAGLYTVVIGLSQRLFVIYTGQRSDAAVLFTAFVVATAFTPVKNSLEGLADRRIARRDPVVAFRQRARAIASVTSVLDTRRLARQVVKDSVVLFGAQGAALYVNGGARDRLLQAEGQLDGATTVIPVRGEGKVVGRLELGSRRGRSGYSPRELAVLHSLADAMGDVFILAEAQNGRKQRHEIKGEDS